MAKVKTSKAPKKPKAGNASRIVKGSKPDGGLCSEEVCSSGVSVPLTPNAKVSPSSSFAKLHAQQSQAHAATEKHDVAVLTADYKAANEKWAKAIAFVEDHLAKATQSETEGLKELHAAEEYRVSEAEKTMHQIRAEVHESKTTLNFLVKKAFSAQKVVQAVTMVLSGQK
ncbi:hypothetical protein HDU86_006434 [Geranomyces michiganensis]|nr:hypothetical protein HDU86_006434 [Geranomyces michiganensis]